ncbi:flagellar protein FlgN [Thiohalorhabdus sp.]|uniref:flagellar protein FlgN n=1 Tax=Thiohalorhabdus sp. TaxID=3094134 RepID=UPI002FC39F59
MTDNPAETIFERLEAAYDGLATFLEEERSHLLAPDWKALTWDQERRRTLTEAVTEADAERRRLAESLGLEPETPFRDLLPYDSGLEQRRQALRSRIPEVQAYNRENTRLLKAAMERNERLIALLSGLPEDGGYTAEGEAQSSPGSGLMSRKA